MRSTPPRFGSMVDAPGFSGLLEGGLDGKIPTATTMRTAITAKTAPIVRARANILLFSVSTPVLAAVAAPPHHRRRRRLRIDPTGHGERNSRDAAGRLCP